MGQTIIHQMKYSYPSITADSPVNCSQAECEEDERCFVLKSEAVESLAVCLRVMRRRGNDTDDDDDDRMPPRRAQRCEELECGQGFECLHVRRDGRGQARCRRIQRRMGNCIVRPDSRPDRPTRRPNMIRPTRGPGRPTGRPSRGSDRPTGRPTRGPDRPTGRPTRGSTRPTGRPTRGPDRPTGRPTRDSNRPTGRPTRGSDRPIGIPSDRVTGHPSDRPTGRPTRRPDRPTGRPVRPTGGPQLMFNLPDQCSERECCGNQKCYMRQIFSSRQPIAFCADVSRIAIF